MRWLLPTCLLAGLACLGPWTVPSAVPQAVASSGAPAAAARQSVAAAQGASGLRQLVGSGAYHAPVGRQLQFGYSFEAALELRVKPGDQVATAGQELRGRLTLSVSGRRGDELLVAGQFSDTRGKSTAGGQVHPLGQLVSELGRPFGLRMRDDGAVLGYRFAPISAAARRQIRALVSQLLFVIPDAAQDRWEVDETDYLGSVRTRYTAANAGTCRALDRQRLRYHGQDEELQTESSGQLRGTYDPELGWMRSVAVRERLQLDIAGNPAQQNLDCRIELIGCSDDAGQQAPDWDRAEAAVSGAADQDGGDEVREDTSDIDLPGLLRDLQAFAAAADGPASRAQDLMALVARLAAHRPEALAELRHFLWSADAHPVACDILLAGLGRADTKACAVLLAAALQDAQLRPALRVSAATATLGLQRPDAVVLRGLEGMFSDPGAPEMLASTGLLLYGAAAGRCGGSALERLLDHESRAADRGRLETWLGALGNAAQPATLPRLRPYLQHEDERLRAAAVEALRGIDSPEVGRLLRETLARERDPAIRSRAARWLGRQPDSASLETCTALFPKAPAEECLALLSGLKRQLGSNPAARRVVEQVASRHADARVREAAARLL